MGFDFCPFKEFVMGQPSWQRRTTLLGAWVAVHPMAPQQGGHHVDSPEFARPVLSSFAPVFYHPTYQRFLVLLLAAVLTTGRRTVSNLLRTAAGLAHGDASSFHRVLSKRRWSLSPWRGSWPASSSIIGSPMGPSSWPATIPSTSTAGQGLWQGLSPRPGAPTHSYTAFRWGHKWVVLAILVQFPFATRAWALPVLTALYHSPEKAAKAEAPAAKPRRKKAKDKTKARAKERARGKASRGQDQGPEDRWGGGTRRPRN